MSSSSEVMQIKSILKSLTIPTWVGSFLEKTFFDKCSIHALPKNEQNRYCITCDASLCQYCIASRDHMDHMILTIYRHVYQNVVPLSEMEMHLECDQIQPYKCNTKWVVSLKPLPHNGSGSLIEGVGACVVCKRKLTDPNSFRLCSITCKVQEIFGTKLSQHCGVGTSRQRDTTDQERKNPSKRKRNRKGYPVRSPFH